jgi:thiamine-monophosphate kinase
MPERLGDIGERGLIELIRAQYGYSWPDDDSAAIEMGKEYLLITTDAISRGSHVPEGASMEKVGYFFAALNLSDIAAMGGRPKYFMSALTFPKDTPVDDLLKIERGIRRCLAKYGVRLIGGDLKQGKELNMAGIAIGAVPRRRILKRTGIRRGDVLCVTGSLGKNAAGYYMWKRYGGKKWAEMLIDIEPRVKEGMFISEYGASSAIDLSDGLFSAISQLGRINRCGFLIDYYKVPIDSRARHVSNKLGIDIEQLAFNFGGEYELLFTVPKSKFARMKAAAARKEVMISEIGKASEKGLAMLKGGMVRRIKGSGYEHF